MRDSKNDTSYRAFELEIRTQRRFCWTNTAQRFLDAVRSSVVEREVAIGKGQHFFRAQRDVVYEEDERTGGCGIYGHGRERMLPLVHRAAEGRANPAGIPVVYAATQLITAISEIRPWVGAELSVATLGTTNRLSAVDLSKGGGRNPLNSRLGFLLGDETPSPDQRRQMMWEDIDFAFAKPVLREASDLPEYSPTQVLAEFFKDLGYQAIIYHSQFGSGGRNVAIFDRDNVEVLKCEPYQVTAVTVDAKAIGAPWFKSHTRSDEK